MEFKGSREADVMKHATTFAIMLKPHRTHFTTLGPAPAALARLKGLYRWHLVIKTLKDVDPSGQRTHAALQSAIQLYRKSNGGRNSSVKLVLDVDPVGMM